MSAVNELIMIKGNKDGLIFILNDECEYTDLIRELEYKLEKSHQRLLSGPVVKVCVRTGRREMPDKDKLQIVELISKTGNLIVDRVESDSEMRERTGLKVITGVVRSGQTITHEGNVILLGDLNPGGVIETSGSLFVLGTLRGLAHAGKSGDKNAVIAASLLRPTQLRIADVVSRPPDEWGVSDTMMEFAYLKDGTMEIDRITNLHKVRPNLSREMNNM